MEKNLKNFITTVINTVDMDKETRKALLLNNSWMECVINSIPIKLYRNEKEYLCNLYYFFRDSSCSIVIYNSQKTLTYVIQANQISEADRYYNNVVARGMYADDPVYKALDRSNTKIQVNMNK